jgi:hypothetical protein
MKPTSNGSSTTSTVSSPDPLFSLKARFGPFFCRPHSIYSGHFRLI